MDEEVKLPPLPEGAFEHGNKYTAPIPKNEPMAKRCDHKGKVRVDPATNELKCGCGACWSGPNINQLYELLKA